MSRRNKTERRTVDVELDEVVCDGHFCTPTNVTTLERHTQLTPGWAILHIRSLDTDGLVSTLSTTHLCPICVHGARRQGPPKVTP